MKPSFQHNLRQIYCCIWQQDTSSQLYAAWYSTTSHLISSLHLYLPHSLCKAFFMRKIINPTTSGCQLSFSLHLDQPLRENRITVAFYFFIFRLRLFSFFFFFCGCDWANTAERSGSSTWEKTSSGTLPGVVLPGLECSRKCPITFYFISNASKPAVNQGGLRVN